MSWKQRKTTKEACERYQNLSKEENKKKLQYDRECYENLSEYEWINWLSFNKNIKDWVKMLYYNYKKLLFEKNNEECKDV